MPDTHPPRLMKAQLLLAAAVVVLLAAGVQALGAVGSARRAHEKLLHDHGRTAAWSLGQFAAIRLQTVGECAFHAVHLARSGVELPRTPSAERVLAEWRQASREVGCLDASIGPLPTLYRFGPGEEVEIAGEEPPPGRAAEVRAVLEREGALSAAGPPSRQPLRRTEYVVGTTLGGEPHLLFFSHQRVRGGVAAWAAAAPASSVASAFASVLTERALVPEPVLHQDDAMRTMGMRIRVEEGGALFHRAAPAGPPVTVATTPLSGPLAGLRAEVEISAAAEALLAPGGLPRGQVSLLGATLLLSLLLVGLAYRQARRERELARLREDFVASVSHELRTPLTVQRLYLDMLSLRRIPDPEERHRALQGVDRENQRLQHIVENVLRFAQSERGRLRLSAAPADLRAAAERAASAVEPLAAQREVRVEVMGSHGVTVRLDGEMFERALTNLLDNAVKYGPEGQRVRVWVGSAGGSAVLTVDDEGPGVPPGERERVFEPFRRGAGAARVSGGSGIGLAVVREIVRLHGGTVRIDRAPRGGARVEIRLPAEPATSPAAVHA